MSYIGLPPSLQIFKKIDFLGDGSTTSFDLADPATSANGLLVIVGGVTQEPTTAYTLASTPYANTLEFTSAPANGVDIWVIWLGSPETTDIDLSTFIRTNQTATLSAGFFDTMDTLSDAASIAWDWSAGNLAEVTLTGSHTLANPTNLGAGSFSLIVRMDATGGWTLSYDTAYKWPAGTAPALDTTANAVNILSFISDGTNVYGTGVTGMA